MTGSQVEVLAQQWQLDILQALYARKEHPSKEDFKQVARETGLGKSLIQEWFKRQWSVRTIGFSAATGSPTEVSASPSPTGTQAATGLSRAAGQAFRANGRRAGASPPDVTHISTFRSPNSKDSSRSNNPTHVTGRVTSAQTLHGLLIAMPGPSIASIRPITPSSSAFTLDSGDATSLHSFTLSPPLERKASALPLLGSSEPTAYASFSAVLAHAFPELAHIPYISHAAETPRHALDSALTRNVTSSDSSPSPNQNRAAFPVSYTTKLCPMARRPRKTCDYLGSSRTLPWRQASLENHADHNQGDSDVDSSSQPYDTGLPSTSDGAFDDISGIPDLSDRKHELQAKLVERPINTSPKSVPKRSSSLRVSRTTKRLCRDKSG